ncbi:SDR family oxidoreductase [Sutcliffiella cohnii]|uniref:3-ketoacyl-ACP reductase n=1 Tax=Sutcliffiella cohnii TaxID=33932 RepID=A0A223KPS0_9BACI|nr:SDR family oxidoreductase [Sutcliffiella cohnii]AST91501.1 3-ketoacyl-ACP reductase [Sutcliffiella cohnii]MED4014931.1 SDR family oxidoreductase [Sutcliffiella cohnii]
MSFKDKVVIVTGGANGIGKSIVEGYAKEEAMVFIADKDLKSGQVVEEEITKNGGRAEFIKTDVTKEADIIQLINTVKYKCGIIHILINNAGKGLFISPLQLTLEEWNDVISTNLTSTFLCTKEAAPYMSEGGAVVNISSTRAIMSEPNSEAYAATKGGILSLTHAFAASLAPKHIRVNAVSPGWIETGDYSNLRDEDHHQHFSRRVGRPSDIVQACFFLTKKENDFITGTNIVVDGGMTKKMIYEE